MGCQRRTRAASGQRPWRKEHSKRVICSGGSLEFWFAPGLFAHPPHRSLPRPGFVENISDSIHYRPTYMASSSSDSWDHPGMKVKRDTCTPETDYNGVVSHSLSGQLRLRHRTNRQADGHQSTLPASSIILLRHLSCLTYRFSRSHKQGYAATSTGAYGLPLGLNRTLLRPSPNGLLHWP